MRKLLAVALALYNFSAFAQDIPNHSMPIGGGAGVVGWKSGGPCIVNQTLVWPGVTQDPTCATILTPTTGVVSFNTRQGAVLPATNDYNFNQLAGQATLAQLPTIAAGAVLANATSGSATPTAATATSWFDQAFCNTVGWFVVRTTGSWICAQGLPANATWWGVKCDGVTNDRAAIITADTATNLKAELFFPGGSCIISSAVTPSQSSAWRGAGYQSTIFKANSAACSLISVTNGFVTLRDISFQSSSVCTSGTSVYINAVNFVGMNLYCIVMWECAKIDTAASYVILDNLQTVNSPNNATGSLIDVVGGQNLQARNILGTTAVTTAMHIRITNASDFTCVDCNLIKAVNNLRIVPGTGLEVDSVTFIGGFIDQGSTNNILADPTGTGRWQRSKFVGTWISGGGTTNIQYSPAGTAFIDGIQYIGCEFFTGTGANFNVSLSGTINSIKNQKFTGGVVSGAGAGSVTLLNFSGYRDIEVNGMRIGDFGGFGNAALGIANAGTNTKLWIHDTDISGNTTDMTFAGTTTSLLIDSNNVGFTSFKPTISACGTGSPSVVGTDLDGTVTLGTGTPVACTITFKGTYANAPNCVVTWQANPLAAQNYSVSTTAITLGQTATSSNKVSYHCRWQQGG